MHECPQCWQICYCDLDDSNDCRENGVCYHQCPPDDDEPIYDEVDSAENVPATDPEVTDG